MPLKFYYYTFILMVLMSCKRESPEDARHQVALSMRDQLKVYVDSAMGKDVDATEKIEAIRIWKDAQQIAEATPGDTLSSSILFRSGALLKAHNEVTKAIGTWGLVVAYYPESLYAPEALFQQAFSFDNDLRDPQNAKRYYQKFLKMYPDHKLAGQVKMLASIMDKSDEELIKEFEKNNKSK